MRSAVLINQKVDIGRVRLVAKLTRDGGLMLSNHHRGGPQGDEASGLLIDGGSIPRIRSLLEEELDEPDLPLLTLLRWAFERNVFCSYTDVRHWLDMNGVAGEPLTWSSP